MFIEIDNPFGEIEGVPLTYYTHIIGWIIYYYLLIPCKAQTTYPYFSNYDIKYIIIHLRPPYIL